MTHLLHHRRNCTLTTLLSITIVIHQGTLDLKRESWGVNSIGIALPASFSRDLEKGVVGRKEGDSRMNPWVMLPEKSRASEGGSEFEEDWLQIYQAEIESDGGRLTGRSRSPICQGSSYHLAQRPPPMTPRPPAREREFVYVGAGGEIEFDSLQNRRAMVLQVMTPKPEAVPLDPEAPVSNRPG